MLRGEDGKIRKLLVYSVLRIESNTIPTEKEKKEHKD